MNDEGERKHLEMPEDPCPPHAHSLPRQRLLRKWCYYIMGGRSVVIHKYSTRIRGLWGGGKARDVLRLLAVKMQD